MLKPFEMNEVEMLFESDSTLEFIKKAATATPEKKETPVVTTEASGEESGESEEEMPEEGAEEGGEETGSDEDLEEIREASMNFMSLSKKDLESLKESDPDLFEELCDAAKEVCEMNGYSCSKEEEE